MEHDTLSDPRRDVCDLHCTIKGVYKTGSLIINSLFQIPGITTADGTDDTWLLFGVGNLINAAHKFATITIIPDPCQI